MYYGGYFILTDIKSRRLPQKQADAPFKRNTVLKDTSADYIKSATRQIPADCRAYYVRSALILLFPALYLLFTKSIYGFIILIICTNIKSTSKVYKLPKGCFILLNIFLGFILSHALYIALHLESSSFPKPLTKKEEQLRFEEMRNGSLEARDILIRHNLRLVAHIVKKYYAGVTEQEDLISIGTIGLIKAVESFNPEKNAKFGTYAARCIENEILMCFRANKKNQGVMSTEESIDFTGDENGLTVSDVMADSIRIDEQYEDREEAELLKQTVRDNLFGIQRQVILMRYGLGGMPPQTQQEVAKILNISRSYVSRIEKKAIEKLRAALGKE